MPEVPDGRRRTRGDYIPAHLPAMNSDKALAGWLWKRGLTVAGGGTPFGWILGTEGSGKCADDAFGRVSDRGGMGWATMGE